MQKMFKSEHETEWVTLSLDEYESLLATIEILSNPKAIEKIKRGEKELKEGNFRRLEDVKKELGF